MQTKSSSLLLAILLAVLGNGFVVLHRQGANVRAAEPATGQEEKADGAATDPDEKQPFEAFDAKSFDRSTQIDNPWFPLKPGTRFTMEGTTVDDEGDQEPHRIVFTVTGLTKTIGGVQTVVSIEEDFADGELEEQELVFFAQDKQGTVWHLGQYPEEYDEGKITATPCWIHGVGDGRAGIMMKAEPKVGDPSYAQGWSPAVEWTDRAFVYQTGQKTKTPHGSFDDVLVIDETDQAEPDSHQLKYYAHGLGCVRVGWRGEAAGQEDLELVKVEQLAAKELEQVHQKALKLEDNAYKHSPDVYARTSPIAGSKQKTQPTAKAPKTAAQARKISDEQAKKIALKKVPGEVTHVGIERKFGKQTIVVEVIADGDGAETDVIIDMETGAILGTET